MHSLLLTVAALSAQAPIAVWSPAPPLPRAVTNNAVAAVVTSQGPAVFSFLGLDTTKEWSGVVNWAFRWRIRDSVWTEIEPVPGPGRLAGTAQSFGNRIYLFGGYTVASDGAERSLPNVDIYDPEADSWSTGAPIPLPVDDAVSGVWRDSLIYLVSGWHDRDNVAAVQIYAPTGDRWLEATPIPGPPVFGHSGAIAGDAIIYVDGTRTRARPPRFEIERSSWRGDINANDPTEIAWRRLVDHPGPPLYRTATAAAGNIVIFAGGSDNPYNYNGVGYNGIPSAPMQRVFGYDVGRSAWIDLPKLTVPTMDHRGIAVAGEILVIVGGMREVQQVSAGVVAAHISRLLER